MFLPRFLLCCAARQFFLSSNSLRTVSAGKIPANSVAKPAEAGYCWPAIPAAPLYFFCRCVRRWISPQIDHERGLTMRHIMLTTRSACAEGGFYAQLRAAAACSGRKQPCPDIPLQSPAFFLLETPRCRHAMRRFKCESPRFWLAMRRCRLESRRLLPAMRRCKSESPRFWLEMRRCRLESSRFMPAMRRCKLESRRFRLASPRCKSSSRQGKADFSCFQPTAQLSISSKNHV